MKLSFLYSRKLANFLLGLIFLALILKNTKVNLLGVSADAYVTRTLVVLAVALAINILLCNLRRLARRSSKLRYRGYIDLTAIDNFQIGLGKMGFTSGSTQHTLGIPYASIVFHLSLLALLIGLLLSLLYGFYGKMYITEGQIVNQEPESYTNQRKGPLASWPEVDYQLAIGSTTVRHEPNKAEPVELAAQLMLMNQHSIIANASVSPNQSFNYGGLNYAFDDYGFAPRLIVCDSKGNSILDAFVNLLWSSQDEVLYVGEDKIELPNNLQIHMRLFPDAKFTENGQLTTLSNELLAPAIWLNVKDHNKQIFSGPVILGQTAKCSNGTTVVFADVRKWVALLIKKDPGYYLMIGSSVVAAVSLLLAVVFPPVHLRLEEQRLVWETDKYPHLLEAKLRNKLGVD